MLTRRLTAALAASWASYAQSYSLLGSSFGVPGYADSYDYVVVGGGNAGLTIAMRLAEQNAGTVAVIEAGSFYEITNGNISQVPATDGYYSGKAYHDYQPLIDWGYETVPQTGALGESLRYARGKTLGGCTARNFMVYHRATVGAYQNWADQVGDQSYTFENFLPFFQKSVNFTGPDMEKRFANSTPEYNAADASGTYKGLRPLQVTFSAYAQAFGTWATLGMEQIGIPIIRGFLSGKLLGQSYGTFTIDATTAHRESSQTSFLKEGLKNPALKVYVDVMAKKIVFDSNKKATGVIVETQGTNPLTWTLSAKKEVILSAGVFNSPQLLMVSGVGPADTLTSLNIPIVAERPGVGQDMNDHIFFDVAHRVNAITLSELVNSPAYAAEQAMLYNENATGIYTNPNTDSIGWEKIPQSLRKNWSNASQAALDAYPADWPEVEYITISSFLGNMQQSRSPGPNDGYNYASMSAALVIPRSRGNVSINSTDTNNPPIINPNWLTVQSDVDVVVAAFKRMRQFWATKSMTEFSIGPEYYPGANVSTDAQIETHIRRNFNTIWHGTSTCKMGPVNDTMSVVDNKARVIGVKGLRVVDASAFAFLTPGHPKATIYALAEKIACDISSACKPGVL